MTDQKNFSPENMVIDLPIRTMVAPLCAGEGEMAVRVIDTYSNGDKRITDHYGLKAQELYADYCRKRRRH